MRSEFEKLPEIAKNLDVLIWFGDDNIYHSAFINLQDIVCFINGAWYAYQEQQKKIDKALELLEYNEYADSSDQAISA